MVFHFVLFSLLYSNTVLAAQETPQADLASERTTGKPEPFAFADFFWLPGGGGTTDRPLSYGPFTGEFRIDSSYHYSLSDPVDHTIAGSTEVFRHGEFQLTHVGFGGDFNYKRVHARLMTQFGMYSQTTARNDASTSIGQWDLANAYRYISEAYAGYHLNYLNGINIQAGIFMSFVGLWSYYNADNWTYQPSYVSANTPWFFNGVRAQIFVTDKLKIEPMITNGWQAYGRFNKGLGVGMQTLWRPTGKLSFAFNQYYGTDSLNIPDRRRIHSDNSFMMKHYENPNGLVTRVATSLTLDAGCEMGGGVSCNSQYFLGFMAYVRTWFYREMFAMTFGGGGIINPGRYLVLIPPINGATASTAAIASPYFSANPGDDFKAWDTQLTFDYIPKPFITFRVEYNHRAANVPYFAGHGGMTPPGGNNGAPTVAIGGWAPDLAKTEDRFTLALLLRL